MPVKSIATLAGAAALYLVLSASKCTSETTFPAYIDEICADKLDNDEDGKSDCLDSDCKLECAVRVGILPPAGEIESDTLTIAGTHFNAASIRLALTPNGTANSVAANADGTWKYLLTGLAPETAYTLTAVATAATDVGGSDTASIQFTRVR